MAIKNSVSNNFWSTFLDSIGVFDCRLPVCISHVRIWWYFLSCHFHRFLKSFPANGRLLKFVLILYFPVNIIFQSCREESSWVEPVLFVWFDSLCPSQQSFSYVGRGLPGLNQYQARINVSCSRTHYAVMPVRLKPTAFRSQVISILTLSHCIPRVEPVLLAVDKVSCSRTQQCLRWVSFPSLTLYHCQPLHFGTICTGLDKQKYKQKFSA